MGPKERTCVVLTVVAEIQSVSVNMFFYLLYALKTIYRDFNVIYVYFCPLNVHFPGERVC